MCPGIAVLGGGGGSGGSGGKGAGGAGAGTGAAGEGGAGRADGDGRSTGEGSEYQGDPVDVITGRVTMEVQDFAFPGPFPLLFKRRYSSRFSDHDVGIGFGWAHSFSWFARENRRRVEVVDDEGMFHIFDAKELSEGRCLDDRGFALERDGDDVLILVDRASLVRRRLIRAREGELFMLAEVRDAHGNTTSLERDDTGTLKAIVDCVGRRIEVSIDRSGRIVSMALQPTPGGQRYRLVTFEHDAAGDLVRAVDQAGYARTYAYDQHLLTQHVLKTGLTYHWRYDKLGRTARCIETWGEWPGRKDPAIEFTPSKVVGRQVKGIFHTRFAYYPDEHYSEVDDARGGLTRYFGNEKGQVWKRVDPLGGVTTREFDPTGRLAAETNANGATIRWDYDGEISRVHDPMGNVVELKRDDFGRIVTRIEPNGAEYHYEYDRAGNVVCATHPDGAADTFVYDSRGQLVSHTDRAGGTWKYHYDAHGNVLRADTPEGHCTVVEYDAFGNKLSYCNEAGRTTRFQYDERGQAVRFDFADGSSESRSYDPEGNLVLVAQPNGVREQFEYSGHNWLHKHTDPMGRVSRFWYDALGKPVRAENPAGEQEEYSLDPAGSATKIASFDGTTVVHNFDLLGNCIGTRRDDGVVNYAYNAFNHQVSKEDPDGIVTSYEYDPNHEFVGSSAGGLSRTLDECGRIVEEQNASGWVKREYDSAGRLVALTSNHGADLRFRWNGEHDLCRLTFQGTEIEQEHNGIGQVTSTVLDRRVAISSTYDLLGRLVTRSCTDGARNEENIASLAFEYDELTHLSALHDSVFGISRYERNLSSQITEAKVASSDGALTHQESFSYTAAGYPQQRDITGNPLRHYGANGQVLRSGDTAYEYDSVGRMVTRQVTRDGQTEEWRFTWNSGDELVRAVGPERELTFAYDALGRRSCKVVRDHQGAIIERIDFVWFDDVLLHEVSSVEGVRTYAFDPRSFAPIACAHDDRVSLYLNDQIGLPRHVVAANGKLAWSGRYSLYGEQLEGDPRAQPIRFQGQYHDHETGLHYNRFRYYDPALGIYLSLDPIGLNGGLATRLYTANPTDIFDPFGWGPHAGHTDAGRSRAPRSPSQTEANYRTRVGEHAAPGGYVHPWTNPSQDFRNSAGRRLRDDIDALGAAHGCHSCGIRPGDPGFVRATPDHTFVPDHQPPQSLLRSGSGAFRMYPQCRRCSNSQGGAVGHLGAAGTQRDGYHS